MLLEKLAGQFSNNDYVPLYTPEQKRNSKKRRLSRTAKVITSILGLICLFSLSSLQYSLFFDHERGFDDGVQLNAKGNIYSPSNLTLSENMASRQKAAFIVLVRNRELIQMKNSMRHLESRFNHRYQYPWIFLNNEPFTEHFKSEIRKMTTAEVKFGIVPKEHWGYPSWVSQEKAKAERDSWQGYRYIKSESYRHMCRYQSGFFFQHPLTSELDYYWRVEPGVEFSCDIEYDPFAFMALNKKVYGWTMSLTETPSTIRTLYKETKEFFKKHPAYLHKDSALGFISESKNFDDSQYNMCHFWSNFEIADLRFWRSKTYKDYFEHLDRTGGFFYERWGDAPIHSIAASLFLNKSDIHYFDDIGYKHENWGHCPSAASNLANGRCQCELRATYNPKSCIEQWKRLWT